MLTLYYAKGSCATAAHIALEEAGSLYEEREINLMGDRTEYLKINPKGTVPALLIDSTLLTENVAILTYLAKTFSAAQLLPTNVLDEAKCLSIMSWFASAVHITRRQGRLPQRFVADEAAQPAVKEAGRQAFWANCQKIDAMLAGKEWLMGGHYTVCDSYAIVFYGWGLRDEFPMHELAAYSSFKNRMVQRPAVRRILDREQDTFLATT